MREKNSGDAADQLARRDAIEAISNRVLGWIGNRAEVATAIPHLTLYRFDSPTKPTSYLLEPSVCLILQGEKRVLLGTADCSYGIGEFLVTSVDLPLIAEILKASPTEPYIGLTLKLDRNEIAQLILDQNYPSKEPSRQRPGIEVGPLTKPLFEAFQRLLELLDEPENIPMLAPLIQKEILFRLLKTESGAKIRQLAIAGDHTHRINRVIGWIKGNLSTRFRVEDLAGLAGMSVSTLHHQFRLLTTMSPLQFQKRLRLNEARQLMLTSQLDAATAAFQVGYESPSQFTREYSRLFGNPPRRDIQGLLTAAGN